LDITDLIHIIERLRGKNGCPWDKKQTAQSIGIYLVEEIYELLEAIEFNQTGKACEELGDVLFLLLFIVNIYQDQKLFNLSDVASASAKKMVLRHPHVFGNDSVKNAEEVKRRWHQIKRQEKDTIEKQSFLGSVPAKLPALMRAYRISERAGSAGFDWDDIDGVFAKVNEEWLEFQKAYKEKGMSEARMEFGDLLFTMVNVARFLKIHPETALSSATGKFENRFKEMERLMAKKKQNFESVSRKDLNRLWDHVKCNEPL
jgi:tetrapyrrole methylase family protein/MazG family protein